MQGGSTRAGVVALPRRPFGMTATGLLLSAGLHAVVVALIYTAAERAVVEQREAERRRLEEKPPPPPPFSFVPAKLLKLGNVAPEEREMPDREVPALPTAPPEPEVTPENSNPDGTAPGARPVRASNPMEIAPQHVPRRPRRAAPDSEVNLVWDRLRQDFPERGGWSRVRGSPDGDPNGTELDPSLVRPGDWYATQLMQFFQDRWTIPNLISARELQRLSCKVRIALDASFRIVDFEMMRSSGNERYDASVQEVLRRLQADRTPLPAVPTAVRDYIIANGMILTWKP